MATPPDATAPSIDISVVAPAHNEEANINALVEEIGRALNQQGIAVRSGHHCAQPILRRFGLEATVRPSLAFYNTCEEIDTLVAVVQQLAKR